MPAPEDIDARIDEIGAFFVICGHMGAIMPDNNVVYISGLDVNYRAAGTSIVLINKVVFGFDKFTKRIQD